MHRANGTLLTHTRALLTAAALGCAVCAHAINFSTPEVIEAQHATLHITLTFDLDRLQKEIPDAALARETLETAREATPGILRAQLANLGVPKEKITLRTLPGDRFQLRLVSPPSPYFDESIELLTLLADRASASFRLVSEDSETRARALLAATNAIPHLTRSATRSGRPCFINNKPQCDHTAEFGFTLERTAETTETGQTAYLPHFLEEATLLTGKDIAQAAFSKDNLDQNGISITFREPKAFARITAENTGRRLAILSDGIIVSAPAIHGTIPNGSAEITGRFKEKEARALAARLNAAALPAPLKTL